MADRYLLEQLRHASLARVRHCCLVPFFQHLPPLRCAHQFQLSDPLPTSCHHSPQQLLQVPHHPPHTLLVPQLLVVLHSSQQPPAFFSEPDRQLKLRPLIPHTLCLDLQPRHPHLAPRCVLHCHHHLEQSARLAAALHLHPLHYLLVRHVLMRIRSQHFLAHPPQQLLDRLFLIHSHSQREGIHKEPDQSLHLRHHPVRYRTPDHYFLAAAVSRQQHSHHSHQQHVGRQRLLPALLLHAPRQLFVELHAQLSRSPTSSSHRPARAIRRQLD